MPRGSMFDEKKDFIMERYENGASIKSILEELGCDWYEYSSLYSYIAKHFPKRNLKHVECEKCKYFSWMQAPYNKSDLPVCIKRKRVFYRELTDLPYKCEYMEVL